MDSGEAQIETLIGRALAPYSDRPNAEGVARLTADLIACGQDLHTRVAALPGSQRSTLAGGALIEWTYFVDAGPTGRSDHAAWNHARALARILRNLLSGINQASRAR